MIVVKKVNHRFIDTDQLIGGIIHSRWSLVVDKAENLAQNQEPSLRTSSQEDQQVFDNDCLRRIARWKRRGGNVYGFQRPIIDVQSISFIKLT